MQPKIEPVGPLHPFDPSKQEAYDSNLTLDPLHPLVAVTGPVPTSIPASVPPPAANQPPLGSSRHPVVSNNNPGLAHPIHGEASNPRPNYRHSGSFTGLAFHNPFDMNSYPITNPPILDSTVLPYGDHTSRHRRISISNGQIGQIVNHEAFFMDEDLFDDLSNISPYPAQQTVGGQSQLPDQRIVPFEVDASHQTATQLHPQLQFASVRATQPAPQVPGTTHHSAPRVDFRQMAGNGHISNLATPGPTLVDVQSHDMAGVPPPNHQLIYNNEVIYNPNNGPIPGTAAWKKERLLERNRIAASKCRQRKKHAQQQLQDNMNKSQNKIKTQTERLEKYEKLLAIYNTVLARHLKDQHDQTFEGLRQFVTKLIDDISIADLERMTIE